MPWDSPGNCISEPGCCLPGNPDYSLGNGNYFTLQQAESAAKGTYIRIPLNEGDRVILLCPDYQPAPWSRNTGNYFIDIENMVTTYGSAVPAAPSTSFMQNVASEQIIVPSADSEGVTWTAPATGTYRFTITGGAVRGGNGISPDVCGACLDGRCYVALVNVYVNHPIIWGQISSCPVVPISPDYSIGSEPFYSVAAAEAATKGNYVEIPLNKGDLLIFTIRDYQTSYPDNSGSITIDAQLQLSDNGITTQKTKIPAVTTAFHTTTPSASQPVKRDTDDDEDTADNMMVIFYTLIIGIILVGILFEGWKVIKNKK